MRTGPGLLSGCLMRYEERARDRAEVFSRGALTWDQGGVVLREMHNREQPICRFLPTADEKEVTVSIKLPDSSRGREAALGVKNGLYRGLSVEFLSTDELQEGGVRRIKRGAIGRRGAGRRPGLSSLQRGGSRLATEKPGDRDAMAVTTTPDELLQALRMGTDEESLASRQGHWHSRQRP